MRVIARILCGSHLYGCSVPDSDRDYKIVYIPSGRNILLQQADRLDPLDMVEPVKRLVKDVGEPLAERSPDVEFISFRKYLKLLCQGQTNALDMFFAPRENFVGKPEPEWYAIQTHEKSWISRNSVAFVGYCRQQASKYVVKIDRFNAVKDVVHFLAENAQEGHHELVGLYEGLDALVLENEHIEWISRETAHGTELAHFSVCQTMIPVTATVKLAAETFGRKLESYGSRVRETANMGAKDWKSLYHAVRVAEEAKELMKTGKLTFPRPERRLLTAIRLGKIPFEKVSDMIEENLETIERAVEESTLPEQPDWRRADSLVEAFYKSAVLGARSSAG